MEKWRRQTRRILGSQFLIFANPKTVIANIDMAEHNPFWEAGCAGSVLHIDSVIRAEAVLPFLKLFIRNSPGKFFYFLNRKHVFLFIIAKINNAFQMRKLFTV